MISWWRRDRNARSVLRVARARCGDRPFLLNEEQYLYRPARNIADKHRGGGSLFISKEDEIGYGILIIPTTIPSVMKSTLATRRPPLLSHCAGAEAGRETYGILESFFSNNWWPMAFVTEWNTQYSRRILEWRDQPQAEAYDTIEPARTTHFLTVWCAARLLCWSSSFDSTKR